MKKTTFAAGSVLLALFALVLLVSLRPNIADNVLRLQSKAQVKSQAQTGSEGPQIRGREIQMRDRVNQTQAEEILSRAKKKLASAPVVRWSVVRKTARGSLVKTIQTTVREKGEVSHRTDIKMISPKGSETNYSTFVTPDGAFVSTVDGSIVFPRDQLDRESEKNMEATLSIVSSEAFADSMNLDASGRPICSMIQDELDPNLVLITESSSLEMSDSLAANISAALRRPNGSDVDIQTIKHRFEAKKHKVYLVDPHGGNILAEYSFRKSFDDVYERQFADPASVSQVTLASMNVPSLSTSKVIYDREQFERERLMQLTPRFARGAVQEAFSSLSSKK